MLCRKSSPNLWIVLETLQVTFTSVSVSVRRATVEQASPESNYTVCSVLGWEQAAQAYTPPVATTVGATGSISSAVPFKCYCAFCPRGRLPSHLVTSKQATERRQKCEGEQKRSGSLIKSCHGPLKIFSQQLSRGKYNYYLHLWEGAHCSKTVVLVIMTGVRAETEGRREAGRLSCQPKDANRHDERSSSSNNNNNRVKQSKVLNIYVLNCDCLRLP